MTREEAQDEFDYLLHVATTEDDPIAYAFLHVWVRSYAGGRHKGIGLKGENGWLFAQIPEHARVYDPGSKNSPRRISSVLV